MPIETKDNIYQIIYICLYYEIIRRLQRLWEQRKVIYKRWLVTWPHEQYAIVICSLGLNYVHRGNV